MINPVTSSTLFALLCFGALFGAQVTGAQAPSNTSVVVARVDGEEIVRGELEAKINSFRGQARVEGFPDPSTDPSFPGRILQALIDQVLLTQYAREKGYSVTAADIDAQQEKVEQSLAAELDLEEALARSGDTLAGFRARLARDLYFDKVVGAEIAPKITITEEAKKEFLSNNQQRYQLPDQTRLRQIIKKFEAEASEVDREAARQLLAGLSRQLREGADFAELARQHSDDPSAAENGGETPWLLLTGDSPVVEKLRALQVGQVASVIESEISIRLVEVLGFQPARLSTLEEAGPDIERILTNHAIKREVGLRVDQVRQRVKIESFL